MAKFKVMKTPLDDVKTGESFELGEIIDRTVKEVEEFEAKYGTDYLELVNNKNDDVKDVKEQDNK